MMIFLNDLSLAIDNAVGFDKIMLSLIGLVICGFFIYIYVELFIALRLLIKFLRKRLEEMNKKDG